MRRGVARLVVEEVLVGGVLGLGSVPRMRRGSARPPPAIRDGRQPLEVGRGRLVEADRRLPLRHLRRPPSTACTTAFERSGTEPWPAAPRAVSSMARGIFSSVWIEAKVTLPPCAVEAAALGQAELRVDRREVLVDHELDAEAHRALFAGLEEGDDVAVERHVLPLQRAAWSSPRPRRCPCRRRCRGRRCSRPARRALNGGWVHFLASMFTVSVCAMSSSGRFLPVPLSRATRFGRFGSSAKVWVAMPSFSSTCAQVVHHRLFHARRRGRRVGRVHLDDGLEMLEGFSFGSRPVDRPGGLGRPRRDGRDQQCEQRQSSHARDGNTQGRTAPEAPLAAISVDRTTNPSVDRPPERRPARPFRADRFGWPWQPACTGRPPSCPHPQGLAWRARARANGPPSAIGSERRRSSRCCSWTRAWSAPTPPACG